MARGSLSTQGFSKGAIVRIHLKDFMTYNEVEFIPGPNLNLILGPNGTGKSTIVSAICLGMSGKPSTIGRATQLGGYVRHGANKASIEIELYNPDGENFIVTREITTDNKSSWKLQRRAVTHAQVEEVIRKLHIQVDNLCQFLPQEQVQNFSRMKDKQLLVGTMNAVGKPELEQQFEELKKLQEHYGAVANNQEKDEIELKKLQEENKRWEGEVKNFKEREFLKDHVKTLEKKKAWLTYKEEVRVFKQAQEKANELREKYNKAAARFKPLEKKINERENLATRTQSALQNKRTKFHQDLNILNQKLFGAEQQRKKIDDIVNELLSKRNAEKKRMESVRSMTQQINSLEKQLADLKEQEAEATRVRRDVERQINDLEAPMAVIQERKEAAKDDERRAKYELTEYQTKVKKVEDVDRNRLESLRVNKPDLHTAVMWLRANKGRFRSPIYEPPVLSMNVVDGSMAKYPENCISLNDLFAFFCEDKGDMNELLRVFREEMRLIVSAVHAPRSHVPVNEEYQPNVPLSDLRNWGFFTYVRELVNAPEPVVRHLCKMNSIHNIPVGDQTTFENFGRIRDYYGDHLFCFFGGDKMINIRGSRYSANKITSIGDVRPSRFLGQSVDAEALANLRQAIVQIEQRQIQARQLYSEIEQQEVELSRQREALRNKQHECFKVLNDGRVINSRLQQKKQQVANLEKEALNLSLEEKNTKLQCAQIIKEFQSKIKEHQQAVEQLVIQDREKESVEIYSEFLRNNIACLQNKLSDEKDQIRQLELDKEAAERELAVAKQRAKEAQEDARRIAGITNRDDLSEELREKFKSLPNDIDAIEDEIHQSNARIQLMGRADQQIVRDYEMRQHVIEQLLDKINRVHDRTSNLKQDMDRLRDTFLPALQELISRINESFGRYYASMKCAGEICLYTGEGDTRDDFQNYGIKIRVKYRSSEPLQELSANHHSGGERAVATALYMLAMQELTQVPFRCVDEINQGMDPINERRVFDLLVQTACRETSAQYFLLTPKLLPGLNYSPNMKIHFVQNGEHVCKEWPIAKHLKAIQSFRRERS